MNREPPLPFRNRAHAAELLAERLMAYRGQRALILAIPRAAVPMARIVADRLDGDLDLVLVRKLRSPLDEECWMNDRRSVRSMTSDMSIDYLTAKKRRRSDAMPTISIAKSRASARASRSSASATPAIRPSLDAHGRIAIVLDDGLATGASMRAALLAVCVQRPRCLICAVPVAAPNSSATAAADADETVCLAAPAYFGSVGRYYLNFEAVEDEAVVSALAHARAT